MIHLIRKYAKTCLVSLVVLAISLPIFVAAAVAPTVTVLPTFHEGGDLPNSVAIAPDGSLYVGNSAGAINQLDPTGKFMRTVNKVKIYTNDLAFSQDGTLLVVTNSSIIRMALDGTVLGTLQATMKNPKSVAVDDLGYIYVVDVTACEVLVFTPGYQYVSRFASKGSALGQLLNPSHITFDKVNRRLLVADTLNNRVQIFDTNGNPLKSFGTAAVAMGRPILPMEFHSPQAVAIEYTKSAPYQLNRYYVLDTMQNMIQVVDPATLTPILFPGKTNNFIAGSVTYKDGSIIAPSSLVYDQVNGRLLVTGDLGVSVFGIDGGGNPLDTTPPVVAIDPVQATVFVPSVTLSGSVEAGSTVLVTSAAAVAPVQMTSPGAWKVVVSSLAAGANAISVSAKDAAGNVAQPQLVNVSYILPAPAVTLASLPAVTNNASLVLAGTVDAGATVKVKNNATLVEGDAVVNGTTWTYTSALAEGVNALSVSASAANTKTSVLDATVLLDTVPPVISLSALSNGSITSEPVQNISGTVTDVGQIALLVNSVPVDVISGAFSTAVTLAEGQNQVVVIAADAAGNTVQQVRSITYDGTKPVIIITDTTLPDNAITKSSVYAIAGSVSEAAQVTVAGSPVVLDSANNWSAVVNLVEGVNTVEIVAADYAGNTSSVKRSATYAPDKIDLAIAIPAQDLSTNRKELLFAGTVSANATNLSYTVNNGKPVMVKTALGRYIFHVDFKVEGTYSIALTAKDSTGLSTTVVRTVIYEKKARHSRSR